jgi:ferrous iron transport protein B
MTLDTLEIGKDAIVSSVDCEEKSLRQHIFDMGLTPGTELTMRSEERTGAPGPRKICQSRRPADADATRC